MRMRSRLCAGRRPSSRTFPARGLPSSNTFGFSRDIILNRLRLDYLNLILTIFLINFTDALNECYQEGVTWDTEGQISISLQVDLKQCIDTFLKNDLQNVRF